MLAKCGPHRELSLMDELRASGVYKIPPRATLALFTSGLAKTTMYNAKWLGRSDLEVNGEIPFDMRLV